MTLGKPATTARGPCTARRQRQFRVGGLAPVLASNAIPVASSVAFTGTETVGQTLTRTYSYSDPDGDAEGVSLTQWYRADDAGGTNEAAISGATGSTYVLQSADVGKYIRVGVTPVAASGASPGVEAFSAYSGEIEPLGFVLVDEAEVEGASAPTLTMSGLSLTAGKSYLLVGRTKHTGVSDAQYHILTNSDSTDANYRRSLFRSDGGSGDGNQPFPPYYAGSGETVIWGVLTVIDSVPVITIMGSSEDAGRWTFAGGCRQISETSWTAVSLEDQGGNLDVGTKIQLFEWGAAA